MNRSNLYTIWTSLCLDLCILYFEFLCQSWIKISKEYFFHLLPNVNGTWSSFLIRFYNNCYSSCGCEIVFSPIRSACKKTKRFITENIMFIFLIEDLPINPAFSVINNLLWLPWKPLMLAYYEHLTLMVICLTYYNVYDETLLYRF